MQPDAWTSQPYPVSGAGPAKIVTVGVYGFNAEAFLRTLHNAEVDLLIDVRERRGVRGSRYAWANSLKLQGALAEAGIRYHHHRELAPTTELRHVQYADDARHGVGKRNRTQLGSAYTKRYLTEILGRADLAPALSSLQSSHCPVLLCVELEPAACHRSLVATRLAQELNVVIEHLRPLQSRRGQST